MESHFQMLQSYCKLTKILIIRNSKLRTKFNSKMKLLVLSITGSRQLGKTSTFCQYDSDCSAEEYGIRYQIVIGATSEKIREKNMIKNWKFGWLCQKGIKYESSAAWKEKISG